MSRRQTEQPLSQTHPSALPNGGRPPGARALSAGAEVAERVARAAGVDRLINEAVEEAIVRTLKSHTIVRALERAAESHAEAAELNADEVRQVVRRALESDVGNAVWDEFLESEQVQTLVERIARDPEIRSAIAAQGAGLISDVGVKLTNITEGLDDRLEQVVRPRGADSETNQAGLATRAAAAAIDFGLLFIVYSLLSGVIASLIAAVFGRPLSVASDAVLGGLGIIIGGAIFAAFWALAGQTPGMRFLAIRVTHKGSHDLTFRRSVARVFCVLLSLLPAGLGYFAILRDPRRRAWADRMVGTEVVYDNVARSTARARSGHGHAGTREPPASSQPRTTTQGPAGPQRPSAPQRPR